MSSVHGGTQVLACTSNYCSSSSAPALKRRPSSFLSHHRDTDVFPALPLAFYDLLHSLLVVRAFSRLIKGAQFPFDVFEM